MKMSQAQNTRTSNAQLLESLSILEPQRRAIRNNYLIAIALAMPLFLFEIVTFFPLGLQGTEFENIFPWLFIPLGIGVIFGIRGILKHRSYTAEFKDQVVSKIFRDIAPTLAYSPRSQIPVGAYSASKLFKTSFDCYKGDDLLQGKIGKTDIMFSDLHTRYYTKNSKGEKRWHTIFKGIFFIADFHKETNEETFVLPDLAEKRLGSIGKMLQKNNPFKHAGNLIQLENKAFEKEFAVYGTNQIEARYCLTPTMMEAILKIQAQFKSQIRISFLNSRMHVAISSRKNNFEPRIFRSSVDVNMIEEMRTLFVLLTSMVEELDLNTRIWGKKAA